VKAGGFAPSFSVYNAEDHDETEKEFLGHKGNFNGEDIIDIVVQQPACATFICRHLYSFFVADEPQVPSWKSSRPRILRPWQPLRSPSESPVLTCVLSCAPCSPRTSSRMPAFNKIKSPAELVVSTLRMVGGADIPFPNYGEQIAMQPTYMGKTC